MVTMAWRVINWNWMGAGCGHGLALNSLVPLCIGVDHMAERANKGEEIIARVKRDWNRRNLESCCGKVKGKKPDSQYGYLVMKQRIACH